MQLTAIAKGLRRADDDGGDFLQIPAGGALPSLAAASGDFSRGMGMVEAELESLASDGLVSAVTRFGCRYWTTPHARFGMPVA